MEMIVEEQIQKEAKFEKINQVLSNGYKFINSLGRKDETQSISQLDQQRVISCSSIEKIALKDNTNDFSSSSYLEIKKNQLFKKYSGRTPQMIHYKFSITSGNLIQKTESLNNQIQINKYTFNKPRNQEQIAKGLIREKTIQNSILKGKFSNLHELTLQNSKISTNLQEQKIKNHTSRKVKIDDYRKLQSILYQKQKKLSLNTKEDKSNIIKIKQSKGNWQSER